MTAESTGASGSGKYIVLLGAIVVQLILGTIDGYSIFWEPLSAQVFPALATSEQFEVMKSAGEDISRVKVVADEYALNAERATH